MEQEREVGLGARPLSPTLSPEGERECAPPRPVAGLLAGRPAWQQILLIVAITMPVTAVLLGAWIGLTILMNRDPAHPVSAEATLNLVIVWMVALIGFPLMHAGQYRMFWRRPLGTGIANEASPDRLPDPSIRVPRILWPWRLRIRHGLLRGIAIAALLAGFAPYGNQRAIAHLLDRFSSGSASRGSLAALLFEFVPIALLCGLAALLTNRSLNRRNAGLCDAREAQLVEAEINWMFSFATALVIAAMLCRFGGAMIMEHLA